MTCLGSLYIVTYSRLFCDVGWNFKLSFSVEPLPCEAANETWRNSENIEIAQQELPAEHGKRISYKCSRKFVKKGGDVKLICLDGVLTFEVASPQCTKTGTVFVF